ncbi:hypothetical protein [Streptomyces sp. NPDC090022]|uniref:hypothetical protein n=1 Tax=Streptomyces sp. NPDC090022 TaxID=3365920 RepID=UPI00382A8699
MGHRTQLSQQDEHLRRARHGDNVRAGLAHVANHLNTRCGDRDPADPITDFHLRAIVRGWAVQLYDWDEQADRLYALIWEALPARREHETRGEFAARLLLVLKAVTS